jgi:hypothetical protein
MASVEIVIVTPKAWPGSRPGRRWNTVVETTSLTRLPALAMAIATNATAAHPTPRDRPGRAPSRPSEHERRPEVAPEHEVPSRRADHPPTPIAALR